MSLPVKSQIPKSILIIFSMFMLLISCSQEEANDNDIDRIREQISEYKKLVVETNKKIVELEGELERLGGTAVLRNSIPVGVTTLTPQPFSHFVKVNANVEAVNAATISPETNGQIRSIPVKKGQKVSAGDVVARLNVAVIESSIREVETSLELAKALFERQKNLWDQQIGSEVQYLQAKKQLRKLAIAFGNVAISSGFGHNSRPHLMALLTRYFRKRASCLCRVRR
jgi:membrane fusion protein, multidrug efflux system